MPLKTSLEFNSHPDIEIVVGDGDGQDGIDHVADLLLTYDPYVLSMKQDPDPAHLYRRDLKGVCYWKDVSCPAKGKTFKVKLERIRAEKTNIGLIAIDLEHGESQPQKAVFPVPDDFKKARRASRAAKKGRSKAREKA